MATNEQMDNKVYPNLETNSTSNQTKTRIVLPSIKKENGTENEPIQLKDSWNFDVVQRESSYMLLFTKVVLMIIAISMISLSADISDASPCDLKTALNDIGLIYTLPTCENDDIKERAMQIRDWGIAVAVCNFIFIIILLLIKMLPKTLKDSLRFFVAVATLVVFMGAAILFTIFMVELSKNVRNSTAKKNDTNYTHLKETMKSWLEEHYISDNLSSSYEVSNSWNRFFIKYDCCAVNQVMGTTNDFDRTPWCTNGTLGGSCEATASQIPRTCCKYVSEDDYVNATDGCHSSVNPGTFRDNCMDRLKKLSVVNISEFEISFLQICLRTILAFEVGDIPLVLLWAFMCILIMKRENKLKKKTTEFDQSAELRHQTSTDN